MHQCITNCPLALFVCLPVFPSLYIDSPNYICIVSICALFAAVVWSFSSVFLFAQWIARFLWPTSKVMCSIGSRQQQQQQHRCVVVVCMPFLSAATVRHLHESANESFTARLYVCLSVFAGAAPHCAASLHRQLLRKGAPAKLVPSFQKQSDRDAEGIPRQNKVWESMQANLFIPLFGGLLLLFRSSTGATDDCRHWRTEALSAPALALPSPPCLHWI